MKRWKIILPTLLVTSTLPLVSMVSCGKDPVDEPSFSQYDNGWMSDTKTASISINWNRTDDDISFSNLSFKYSSETISAASVEEETSTTCPRTFIIHFTDDVKGDIEDGVFSFKYNDKTIGIEKQASITGIKIIDLVNIDVYCNQASTFTYETDTYDVVQSEQSAVVGREVTKFGVDLTQYGDNIQDTAPIFFGTKIKFLGSWTLLGLSVESIGYLRLGKTQLTEISGSGDGDHTYWIEIQAPTGGWKKAISTSADGHLTGSYIFNVNYSDIVLMFGQLRQTK